MSSSSDVAIDAPKETYMLDPDPSSFYNVKPENVAVLLKNDRVEVTRVDKRGNLFTIKTPLLEAVYPKVAGEGDLGGKFSADRGKARFELTLRCAMANMEPEMRDIEPTLPAQQLLFFKKLYEIGRQILGALYDLAPADYSAHIEAAKTKVIEARVQYERGRGSDLVSVSKIKKAMKSDAELREAIESQYRDTFIDGARYMFPNPDEFDENGCKLVEDEKDGSMKTMHMQVSCKRKVWKLKKGKNAKTAAALPPFNGNKVLPDKWPALRDRIEAKDHNYNPFTWMDPSGGDNAESDDAAPVEIERPLYTPRGLSQQIEDVFWDPFKGMSSLVSTTLLFSVIKVDNNYGVKVLPFPKVYIWRQKELPASNPTAGVNKRMAGGFKRRERTTDNIYGNDDAAVKQGDVGDDDDLSASEDAGDTGAEDEQASEPIVQKKKKSKKVISESYDSEEDMRAEID